VLQRLQRDPVAREIIRRAHQRDRRYGSGDVLDFALFIIDETLKNERRRLATSAAGGRDDRDA
jgi:hypothetical protein